MWAILNIVGQLLKTKNPRENFFTQTIYLLHCVAAKVFRRLTATAKEVYTSGNYSHRFTLLRDE